MFFVQPTGQFGTFVTVRTVACKFTSLLLTVWHSRLIRLQLLTRAQLLHRNHTMHTVLL